MSIAWTIAWIIFGAWFVLEFWKDLMNKFKGNDSIQDPQLRLLDRVMDKSGSGEIDACPWFTLNRLDNTCTCREYGRGATTMVVVDKACLEHGTGDTVEQADGSSHNKDDADFTCA